MSIDLIVSNPISATPQTVTDQNGNTSALSISNSATAVNAEASGSNVQLSINNPTNATNEVAGVRFTTGSGWNVMLRTRQDNAWLELTASDGSVQHTWFQNNYTTTGVVTAGSVTAESVGAVQLQTGQLTATSSVTFSGIGPLPATGTVDLVVGPTGQVSTQLSSARFKENVQPLQDDFHKILSANPVSFVNRTTGAREIGYIAEDFHEKELENLVSYDTEGTPLSIQYKMLPIYALEIIKEQNRAIQQLQEEIAGIKEKLH